MSIDLKEVVYQKNEAQFLSEMANWNVVDKLKGMSVPEILTHQPNSEFAIAMLNVDGGLNIGSIIRSSVIFGADKVFLIGRRRYDRRSAVGAQNYMNVNYIDCDPTTDEGSEFALNCLAKYTPVAVELGGQDIDTYKHRPSMCYIFGSEREGIPEIFVNKIKDRITIPQLGVMRSLNVSVAAGIVMYEATKGIREFNRFNMKGSKP